MSHSTNSARAHCRLWVGLGWVVAGWASIQGAGYLYGGDQFASSDAWHVLKLLPGGMRTHGAVMCVFGLALLFLLRYPTFSTRIVLRLFCGYATFVTLTVLGSWWITRDVTLGLPLTWLAFAAISSLMILYPPPPQVVPLDLSYFRHLGSSE